MGSRIVFQKLCFLVLVLNVFFVHAGDMTNYGAISDGITDNSKVVPYST